MSAPARRPIYVCWLRRTGCSDEQPERFPEKSLYFSELWSPPAEAQGETFSCRPTHPAVGPIGTNAGTGVVRHHNREKASFNPSAAKASANPRRSQSRTDGLRATWSRTAEAQAP